MYNHPFHTKAVASIFGGGVRGTATFYQQPEGVLVKLSFCGLPKENTDGFFALHIHEGATCAGEKFSETGGHYNPKKAEHPSHAGDLPPLLSCQGRAYMSVLTDRFSLKEIVGRTIIIHSGTDDFRTQPSGNAGEKLACGEIKWV